MDLLTSEFAGAVVRAPAPSSNVQRGLIRILDKAAAGVLLIATAPIVLAASTVLVIRSGRSPLIAHRRVGKGGVEFWMLKLRTMWNADAPRSDERGFIQRTTDQPIGRKRRDDERVTDLFAAFCRRHSIDELPQLWHVVKGEMSLVGPRPVTRSEMEQHYGLLAPAITSVRPGLSGLWQVSGRNRLDYARRVELDLALVYRSSLRAYLTVLLRTIPAIFTADGAW